MNKVPKIASREEVVFIPRGMRHINPYNKENEKLILKRTLHPDGGLEMFYRKLYQLARDGKLNRKGEPGLLQISVIAKNNLTQTQIETELRKRLKSFSFAPVIFLSALKGTKVSFLLKISEKIIQKAQQKFEANRAPSAGSRSSI